MVRLQATVRTLGSGLAFASVVTIAWAFLARTPATTISVVRLDDYETSWPNHLEVQALGKTLLAGTDDVEVQIAPDLSTLDLVTDDDDTADQRLADAADKLVALDIERQRTILERDAAVVESRLDDVRVRLAVASADSRAADVESLAEQLAELEREQLIIATDLDSVRSLFVPAGPPSSRSRTPATIKLFAAFALAAGASLVAIRSPR